MLDFFSIFSKGGILLWCFKGELTFKKNEPNLVVMILYSRGQLDLGFGLIKEFLDP